MTLIVRLVDASKRYGDVAAMAAVNLHVEEGEFFTLLGPSGCGKTTTLRSIAGFVQLTEGEVFIRDRPANHLPPHLRDVGMVFQNYALFPHMTVRDNIAFGLRMHKLPRQRIAQEVERVVRLIRLEGHEHKHPRQLSGGQQQRVALARVIVLQPSVLLFDEPLGALDKQLREQMQLELKRLQQELGITSVYVTHDQEEALTMSDRIAVMNQGRVLQVGTPREIYERPSDLFVAGFIGHINFLHGHVSGGRDGRVAVALGQGSDTIIEGVVANAVTQGQPAVVAIRPEKVHLLETPTEAPGRAGPNSVTGTLRQVVYLGEAVRYVVEAGGDELLVTQPALSARDHRVGEVLTLAWDPDDARVFPGDEATSPSGAASSAQPPVLA